jgi:hypothetical protein
MQRNIACRTAATIAASLCLAACGSGPGAPTATGNETASAAAADIPVNAAPFPACKDGDGRIPIPSWSPTLDDDGHLSAAPPQRDGMVVRIDFGSLDASVDCTDEAMNSFALPEDPSDASYGGLYVNIKGNTNYAVGECRFSGYYMNQDVPGIHQGWTETFFGAVDKQTLVLSNKYCLASGTHVP